MTALAFNIAPGAKLDYTFDLTAELAAISQTIDGTPSLEVTPSSFASNVSSGTIDGTTRKITYTITVPEDTVEQEVSLKLVANATGAPDRNFVAGLTLRIKDAPPGFTGGLTTVARLVQELGVTDPDQQILLSDHIAEATDMVERYCGRTFARGTITEKLPGYGSDVLTVSRTPLVTITSVSFDGVALDPSEYQIDDSGAGFISSVDSVFYDTSVLSGNLSRTPLQDSNRKRYTAVYVGGYILPGQPGRTLPPAIERACIETVKYLRAGGSDTLGGSGGAGMKRESVPGVYEVEYGDVNPGDGNLPDYIGKMLNPFRRVSL